VITDGVLNWILDLLTINTRLVITLYRWLTYTDWCPPSITVSTSRFLATDFNTGTITVSLNYTLQISHIVFFSQPNSCNWLLSSQPPVENSSQLSPELQRHFFLASLAELNWTGCFKLSCSQHLVTDHIESTLFSIVCLLFRAYSFPRERVNRTVAQKRSLTTEPQLSNGSVRHNVSSYKDHSRCGHPTFCSLFS
jgi:hypothetical protein